MIDNWKRLPVREFIQQCNWQQITLPKSPQFSTQRRQSLTHWRRLTARNFFALQNWSGQVAFADGLESVTTPIDFSLTLPAGQFWQCFNWLAEKPALAPERVEQIIEQTEEAIAEVTEFSLNDLSQLF